MSLEQLDASGCTSLEMVSNSNIIRNSMKFLCFPMQPAFVVTKEFSVFSGCLKLDQNARDNMITEFQLRSFRPIVRTCVPGNEIPDWFNYSSEGHTFEIKLQPK
ncbi:hypothetical protein PanWU01x14_230640 [Parasponia andersonii]|uniref:LRR domain containing protein n=1 Tax=Parasponia andersonii TaxID=3476 RepID=A0A2P5BKS4_PARAD|nr:hypothetical protein PanWU01x14_230640 [Parasponia andersonii]